MNTELTHETEIKPCQQSRRHFLSRLTIAVGTIAGAIVAIPSVAFLLGLRKVPHVWRTVGKLEDFQIGSTVNVSFLDPSPLPWAGVTALTAAWLRRESAGQFMAFSVDCTHLGCPVRWLPKPISLCAPAMAGFTMQTARWLLVRLPDPCGSIRCECKTAKCRSSPVRFRLPLSYMKTCHARHEIHMELV